MTPLERAIKIAGSQSKLADAIGKKQGHVWAWLQKDGHKVPAEMAAAIEAATGVTRQELRPDIFGGMTSEAAQ